MPVPVILTIAGSDCSAGAGIQADLKTITALGGYGLTAVTGIVAETPLVVSQIQLVDADVVREQVRLLVEAYPIAAAKTGMLGGKAQIDAVVSAWQPMADDRVPLVVDPVMVATSGGRLLDQDAEEALVSRLFPLATLLTPNLDEAAVLVGEKITTRAEMEHHALALSARHRCAILLKGGHLSGDDVPDVLAADGALYWLEGRRIHGVHTHGTGCTYSAAIATGLGHGLSMLEAVRQGKEFVTHAIANHLRWGGMEALNHNGLS
jgi:hydroxymethylpyrimidine/phosphomethylpyrimidine kinase